MKHCTRALWLLGAVLVLLAAAAGASADPCLVVYPDCPCIYRYDVTEYYTVGPGDPLYDPMYDRGGLVLLETGTDEIDPSIYQAPMLSGFEPSVDGNEGYIFVDTDFNLIVDGFSNAPVTYVNVLLIFDTFVPMDCEPTITVNGMPLTGFTYPVGDLAVSTPTPEGNNYSDTITLSVSWRGCYGLHMWAFSDENYNGERDGNECFTAYSHDSMVPSEDSSWGAVKSLFE
jgi:hypothetical protein